MKKLMALAMAAAFSAPAFAGDFYAGADIGHNRFSDSGVKLNRTGYSLFGGYKLNSNVALELGYRSFLNDSYTAGADSADVKIYGLQASGVFSFPVSNDISLFGRLGFTNLRADLKVKEGGNSWTERDHTNKFLVGVGGSYAINKDVSLRVEFQKPVKELNVFAAGVQVNF